MDPMVPAGFPGGSVVKNSPAKQETWVRSLGQEEPLEREMATHSRFLPGKPHGQRNLAGCSPWGCKESDTTERLSSSSSSSSMMCAKAQRLGEFQLSQEFPDFPGM